MYLRLKLTKNNGKVVTYRKGSLTRFIAICSLTKFKKAHVFASYGRGRNASGHIVQFTNSGTYERKADAIWALKAFSEE